MRPLDIQQIGNELAVKWNDGRESFIPLEELRRACPCAGCKEDQQRPSDPFHILKASELQPLRPVALTPVGHYAYKIAWSDGHDTGIFTLENLRALCQCEQCTRR